MTVTQDRPGDRHAKIFDTYIASGPRMIDTTPMQETSTRPSGSVEFNKQIDLVRSCR